MSAIGFFKCYFAHIAFISWCKIRKKLGDQKITQI